MSINNNEKDDLILDKYKISVNEKLLKSLDNYNRLCVKFILKDIDINKYNKYLKLCEESVKEENNDFNNEKYCYECFKKFILEDLVYLKNKI